MITDALRFGLLALPLLGCAREGDASPRAPEGTWTGPLATSVLLPFEHDTVLSYETLTDTGEPGLLILQVRKPRHDLVELDIAGRVQRLDVSRESVMHASGGYLLKDPITEGATFRGSFGDVHITEVERTIEVPAGRFERCVVTVEESSRPRKRSESTYCPGVGLVSLVVEGASETKVKRVESRLKAHGPRVTLY